MHAAAWRQRIVGYSEEPPDQLQAHPLNWRLHPHSQQEALSGVLREVGIVQNIVCNRRTGIIIDGHLRVALALREGQASVPVTWVDLGEEEERLILATLDPIGALAATDAAKLDELLREVSTADSAVQQLLDEVATKAGIVPGVATGGGGIEELDDDDRGEVDDLLAPFPWFGGKARVAGRIWQRFGAVDNYIEPFCGSAAVLLACPYDIPVRTVNDADGYIANFWRALATDPAVVARHADWPVNEADLLARHIWLVKQRGELLHHLHADPDWHDAKVAGWWVWGCCAWIGGGWCSGEGPWSIDESGALINARNGDPGQGVNRQLPHLGDPGRGVNRKLPHLGDPGQGVNRQLPHLGDPGQGDCAAWSAHLQTYMQRLADKLRRVRVACGDWARVVTPSVTTRHGLTAVLLDPPYGEGSMEYSGGGNTDAHIAAAVWAWAVEHGDDPLLRIAVCAYDDDRALPPGWTALRWTARKGYQATEEATQNPRREIVYFSPHCIP